MKKKTKSAIKKLVIVFTVIVISLAFIIVPCKLATTVSDGLSVSSHTSSKPLLVAHRGFSSIRPENTMSAFHAAVGAGFDGYEFDIHTTKDGEWVVIHDDTVDKMTDGTGEVDSFTLEEIRKLNIDAGNGLKHLENLAERATVPTLEEALYYAEEYDIIPVIELKKCDVQYLPDLKAYLDGRGLSEKAVIISFTKEYLEAYRALDKDVQIYWLTNNFTKEDAEWCKENDFGINFNYILLYKNIGAVLYAKNHGMKLAAWTVDNTVYKDVMTLFGVDVITTNKIKPVK